MRSILSKREGLVLVCGPAGSGKTTMLYTMLDELANPARHMASVETHVSYSLPAVSQMEIRPALGLTAAASLRAQLKHDVDVVMIDCVLDEDVAMLAANAANRGVLVLLSVEADSAAEGIEQVLELGVEPHVLAATFVASVGLHMMPKLCGRSREAYKLSRTEQNSLEETTGIKYVLDMLKEEHILDQYAAWKDVPLWRAVACEACEAGYSGAVGVQEILPASKVIKELIRAGADEGALKTQSRIEGNASFEEDRLYKAAQGLLSVEELLA